MRQYMKLSHIIVLLLLACVLSCSKDSITGSKAVIPEDILTKNDEISGWKYAGESWNASSSGELNTYINGEEPVYTRHGFIEASMQKYEGRVLDNSATIELRIFDQGNAENAASLHQELTLQLVNPIDWSSGAGEEARIERFPLSQRILYWKSKYFVSLTITSGLDEALDVLKTFAINIDSKIE